MGAIARLIRRLGGVWPVCRCSGGAGSVYVRLSTKSARIFSFGRMVLGGGGAVFGEHRIHRYTFDADNNYFGYDLLLDSGEGGAVYRLAFEPLSIRPDQFMPAQLRGCYQSGEQKPLEQLPTPQVVSLGHALKFGLVTADGKYKVIERIELSKP